MPNTLAHIGIQGLATRSFIRDADFKWVLLGCVLPDIPWITWRVIGTLSDINLYDLRLYAIVQSSLFFSLILSLALSTFSKTYWRTFAILSMNSFLHLIFDSLQTKWGIGVHLMAPFNWNMTNFGLFWPDSIIIYIFTAFGFLYILIKWPDSIKSKAEFTFRPIPSILILSVYIILPFMFFSGPKAADNHYVKTLSSIETRRGKNIELDRVKYKTKNEKRILITYAKEEIEVEGIKQNTSDRVSIQGSFIDNKHIRVSNYHFQYVIFRDTASYIGLLLVLLFWLCSILSKKFSKVNFVYKKSN